MASGLKNWLSEQKEKAIETKSANHGKITKQVWEHIKEQVKDHKTEYEIHLWNEEEFKETGQFKVFIGTEVNKLENIPIELDCLIIPAAKYACYTAKGKSIHSTQTDKVIPKSEYPRKIVRDQQWEIQVYDNRWKNDDLDSSELDYMVLIE